MRPLTFPEVLNVRTGVDLRARIEAAAAIEGRSASQWVRDALASITAPATPALPVATPPANVGASRAAT